MEILSKVRYIGQVRFTECELDTGPWGRNGHSRTEP